MMDEQEYGNILEVIELRTGDETVAAVVIGAVEIPLSDCYDFEETGGEALVYLNGDESDPVFGYTGYDDETSTLLIDQSPIVDENGDPILDENGDPLVPPPPLTINIPLGTPIYVEPVSIEKRAWVQAKDDDDDEPVYVRVPHSMKAVLSEGVRTDDTGYESVGIETDGSDWVITDIIGEPAKIDGAAIENPDDIPPGSPPSSSSTPVIEALGVGTISWEFDPVIGVNSVRYRVWAEAFAAPPGTVTQDDAHLVYDGSSPMGTFDAINGDPLIPEDATSESTLPTYYVQAQAYNSGGGATVSAVSNGVQPRRAGQKEFSAEIIYANTVELNQIQGGRAEFQFIVGNEIATDVEGNDRVVMASEGLYSEVGGERKFDVPAGGSPTFKGTLESEEALFTQGFEARGESILAPNSSTRLSSSLTSPNSSPVVVQNRPTTPFDFNAYNPLGLVLRDASNPWWDASVSRWKIITRWVYPPTYPYLRIVLHVFDSAGAIDTGLCLTLGVPATKTSSEMSGFFMLGGKYFLNVIDYNSTPFADLMMFNTSSSYEYSVRIGSTNAGTCTVGTDGTDIWVGKINLISGLPDGFTTTAIPANTSYAYRVPLTVVGSTFSLGTTNKRVRLGQTMVLQPKSSLKLRTISASRTPSASAFDYAASTNNIFLNVTAATGTSYSFAQTHASFRVNTATESSAVLHASWYGEADGLCFNSTDGYFWGFDLGTKRLMRHAHNLASGITYDFAFTWSDNNATGGRHETLISPISSPTLYPRNEISIQSSAIPSASVVPTDDDVNGARFYVRNRLAGASLTRTWRVGSSNGHVTGTPGMPVMSAKIDTDLPANADAPAYNVDTGLTRAPTANSFASSTLLTVHKFYSEGDAGGRGIAEIGGDGFSKLPGLVDRPVRGTCTSPSAAASTNTFVNVTYPASANWSVSTIPTAIVVLNTTFSAAPLTYWINNQSATGFRLNVRREGAALGAVDWSYIAVA